MLVVPVGSTVTFPNHDPFNHNVFSLSEENPFDLGLYGRGEIALGRASSKPGLVRVYCNVHAQMSALILVRDTPWYTQPSSDGSFTLELGAAGRLHPARLARARARDDAAPLTVPADGRRADSRVELDARGLRVQASPQQARPAVSAAGPALLRAAVRWR